MFAVLTRARKAIARASMMFAFVALAACDPAALTGAMPGAGGPSIDTTEPVPVALLVPGGSANPNDEMLARALTNAARMAVADLEGAKIDLRVYNTAGNASQAASVAAEAVNDGAKVILGPLYAEAANAAGVAVAPRGINVLAFSNNTTIAGGNVFVLGPTFENTARRLARYAAAQGRDDILIVHPASVEGAAGRAAIESAVMASGARIAGAESFEFSQQGVINAVPRISSAARSSNADSVFLAANTAGALPLLAQMLPENGVAPGSYQYIGLTRWDIPAQTLDLPGLQGGWFALPDPGLTANFNARYSARYGGAPHPVAGLAYDGIAAIGALVRGGNRDALTARALTQGAGFQGTNGIFRLRGDGTNERGLAVAQIQNNQVSIIDPAPRSFGGAGF